MKALKRALAGALMLCALTPALAKTTPVEFASGRAATFITDDPGGVIVDFVKKYSDMRDAGTNVVIDGECVSACTILLGVLRPDKVCVTPDASFGFHSASSITRGPGKPPVIEHAQEISVLVYNMYPGRLRAYLAHEGWSGANPHPDVIWVKGKQLQKFIRPCTPADLS
jgi:hypothetical protein